MLRLVSGRLVAQSTTTRSIPARGVGFDTPQHARRRTWQGVPVARPSIVPIALTVDDRPGYPLWAPPWEEDGEEWQAFLGTTEDDTAKVHLFPTPAVLAAFCHTS